MIEYLLCFSLVLISIWLLKRRKKNEIFWKHFLAIPGPPTYPLVGNIEFICKDAVKTFEYERQLAKTYNPIYRIWFFNVCFVSLHGPEDIEKVLTNQKHNQKGNDYDLLHDWLGTGLLTSNGSKWQTRRKILTPGFHFSILQEFVSIFNKNLDYMINQLKEDSSKDYIEVNTPITQFTINAIGETSMGVTFYNDPRSESYKNALIDYSKVYLERVYTPWLRFEPIFSLTSLAKKRDESTNTLHSFANNVIKERQELFKDGTIMYTNKKRMAMLDLILSAMYKGADISEEGIREEVDTFMFAGHDTTSASISHALMVLANEPEMQKEAYQEIMDIIGDNDEGPSFADLGELKYLERFIKEVLRLYPSAPSISRIAGEDIVTSQGYVIPKGTNIVVYIYDLHRNPKLWENPEKFDPDRFLPENIASRHPYSFIPFSAGARNCIGQKYAMLEMKAALCGLIKRFRLEPVDKPEDIHYKTDLVLRPLREIRVKFVPRV